MTLTAETTGILACATAADLFQNPLLEEPSVAKTVDQRREQAVLQRKAEALCLECPLMVDCLFRAVVNYEVAGYCAGTTQRQRTEMRQKLNVQVDAEDFDLWAGVNSGHQINHEEVLRLRAANPTASLESIAQRMGCSLSTVKRHLRKARRGETVGRPARLKQLPPSREQVMSAYADVVTKRTRASQTPNQRAA